MRGPKVGRQAATMEQHGSISIQMSLLEARSVGYCVSDQRNFGEERGWRQERE